MRSPLRPAGVTHVGLGVVDDVPTARARNIRTGEICSARVVLLD